jgi:putative SOS response-associated peptidase YedK
MCNLYALTHSRTAVIRWFGVTDNRASQFEPLASIFPGHEAPVLRVDSDGALAFSLMHWGFVLPQPGRAPKRVTNVRDDRIQTSRFWTSSFEDRRCLVPASSYCEPSDERPARWHWFALKGEEPRPLFAFPGIWRRWKGPVRKDGPVVEQEVFAFLTTSPNSLTATINHERMPVLLSSPEEWRVWLNGRPSEAFSLTAPYAPDAMHIVRSGASKADTEEGSETIRLADQENPKREKSHQMKLF